ncbi:MAG: hypothetical protein ACLQVI_37580 [Polyangiaceae bacterium]
MAAKKRSRSPSKSDFSAFPVLRFVNGREICPRETASASPMSAYASAVRGGEPAPPLARLAAEVLAVDAPLTDRQ